MTRDEANHFANLAEDLDGAQMALDAGNGAEAKRMVEEACLRFKERKPNTLVRGEVAVGRIMVTITTETHRKLYL